MMLCHFEFYSCSQAAECLSASKRTALGHVVEFDPLREACIPQADRTTDHSPSRDNWRQYLSSEMSFPHHMFSQLCHVATCRRSRHAGNLGTEPFCS